MAATLTPTKSRRPATLETTVVLGPWESADGENVGVRVEAGRQVDHYIVTLLARDDMGSTYRVRKETVVGGKPKLAEP
jgi:hypothetical protein